jgi:hypothetical protein
MCDNPSGGSSHKKFSNLRTPDIISGKSSRHHTCIRKKRTRHHIRKELQTSYMVSGKKGSDMIAGFML